MIKISHIINPFNVDAASDLYTAQPVTFKTMNTAREFAEGKISVKLYSAHFPEDKDFVPDYFIKTRDMTRSILDINSFKKKKKLPLIKEILDKLYESSDAEYFIYTNSDIALQPYFYVTIKNIIGREYDAFTINRRTISKEYKIDQLMSMYADIGEPHPGHDCFVFKRSLYPRFNLGAACIGADWIGRVLITNLICHSEIFKVFKDMHLTFHIGDDRSWKAPIYNDYDNHNKNELHKILLGYKSMGLLKDKPLVNKFLYQIEGPPSKPISSAQKLSYFKEKMKKVMFRWISTNNAK